MAGFWGTAVVAIAAGAVVVGAADCWLGLAKENPPVWAAGVGFGAYGTNDNNLGGAYVCDCSLGASGAEELALLLKENIIKVKI